MKRLFGDGDVTPFLSLQLAMERAIRAQCSEHVILQVHDAVYAPVKRATAQVHDAIAVAMGETLGVNPFLLARTQRRTSIAALRRLLEDDAKERELQDALLESGLLALTCRVIQEVAMNPTEDYRGMRMDLVLDPNGDDPVQIVELKRGSHLLLARQGKPTERLSQELRNAVKQTQDYGRRLGSDPDAITRIEERHGLRIERPELRLVAGRRLPNAGGYHLLSLAESDASDPKLQLQIYTWDGFLAELERIGDQRGL